MNDRRRVVLGVPARTLGVGDDRRAQGIVGIEVCATHAFIDHVGHRHGRVFPAHVHTHLDECDDDARVLADRTMALGAHARIGEDLGDRVLGRRGRLGLVCSRQRVDVVHRVIVGDVLQRVGNAADEIFLLDRSHGGSISDALRSMRAWGAHPEARSF